MGSGRSGVLGLALQLTIRPTPLPSLSVAMSLSYASNFFEEMTLWPKWFENSDNAKLSGSFCQIPDDVK